ncbi:MAG: hypothetical protein K8I00_05110 [Candidatus Omnitrophica bacterium]|nr:hypothetical protein [Candidatus Omnitrophota bacterium]
MHTFLEGQPVPAPEFPIAKTGSSLFIDYTQYGSFSNLGTPGYHYRITDRKGLKDALGAGIYPNHNAIKEEPDFEIFRAAGKLSAGHWDILNSDRLQEAFYIWPPAPDSQGTKNFFTAVILERSGHIAQAIKAYYACLVHTPKQSVWGATKEFVWYTAPAAMSAIRRLCATYPDLNCALVDATVEIQNGEDTDLSNDIIAVNPGRIIHKTLAEKKAELPALEQMAVTQTIRRGDISLLQFENGHWQMRIDGKPFIVRGITYAPTEIGIGPHTDPAFYARWMTKDTNQNGVIDAPYESWVDHNTNGIQDADEPAIGDFQLLKDIGVNAIRYYIPADETHLRYDPGLINKPLLRDMFHTYGIRVIAGDLLGAYTVGSGADWESGTDYRDPVQRQRMLAVLRAKVMDLKDEPFILMWLLGNENNMPLSYSGVNATKTNASQYPQAYAEFLNEAAAMIHAIDGNHPVAVGNLGTGLLDDYNKYAPNIDIIGINSYQGSGGFGAVWETAQARFDRPVIITEFGCDAYAEGKGPDEEAQRAYHQGNLTDIVLHQAGGPSTGNAVGSIIFQYLDEWWKDTHSSTEDEHQTKSTFPFPCPDGFSHEEWYGLVSQGSGKNSPFERHLRKAYFFYKDSWGTRK